MAILGNNNNKSIGCDTIEFNLVLEYFELYQITFGLSWAIWGYLSLSLANLGYHGLSWTISVSHLSRANLGYLGLSLAITGYLGLS